MTAITLPLNKTDGDGFLWDIQADGIMVNGTGDAYDGMFRMAFSIDGGAFKNFVPSSADGDDTNNTVTLSDDVAGSVTAGRKIYVSPTDGFARYLESFTNNGPSDISVVVRISGNLGSDSFTTVLGTSSGDLTIDATDLSFTTDDGTNNGGDPALSFAYGDGTGGGLSAAQIITDSITVEQTFTVGAGEVKSFLHFAGQSSSRTDALNKTAEAGALTPELVADLDPADFAQIINYDIGAIPLELIGTSAADVLNGAGGDDEIFGFSGNDVINGQGGKDVLIGGAGDDVIDGGVDDDMVSGGRGADRIRGDGDLSQTTVGTATLPENAEQIAISMTAPDGSLENTVCVSGFINQDGNAGSGDFNVAYVIDVSGSMSSQFQGTQVGDENGDGAANELMDGAILSYKALNDSLINAGIGSAEVAVIPFGNTNSIIYQGSAQADANNNGQSDVDDALRTLDSGGGTPFDLGLQNAISFFNSAGAGQNHVFFVSDGSPDSSTSFLDEAETLRDANGFNATIRALGLGNGASLSSLDILDDGIANNSAIRVLDPAALSAGLTGSGVERADVDRVEILLNGNLAITVAAADLIDSPFGLKYDVTLSGLDTNADDVIEARVIMNNPAQTVAFTSQTLENDPSFLGGDDALFGGAGNDEIHGDSGEDRIHGDDGNDILFGGDGIDVIKGGDGDDTIDGGHGNDRLFGGLGDDIYILEAGDIVFEGANAGVDEARGDLDALPTNFENITLTGSRDIEIFGTADDNAVIGNVGANILRGGGGDDRLEGGGGNDILLGQDGDDVLFGGAGRDFLRGHVGNDSLSGGDENDVLNGEEGDDTLDGGANTDKLIGLTGADRLDGGSGADRLFGNSGDDVLIGGEGNDVMSGSFGADVFVFAPGSDIDSVIGFETGIDQIDIQAFGFANFAAVDAIISDINGRAQINLDGNSDVVRLFGVLEAGVDAGDFII